MSNLGITNQQWVYDPGHGLRPLNLTCSTGAGDREQKDLVSHFRVYRPKRKIKTRIIFVVGPSSTRMETLSRPYPESNAFTGTEDSVPVLESQSRRKGLVIISEPKELLFVSESGEINPRSQSCRVGSRRSGRRRLLITFYKESWSKINTPPLFLLTRDLQILVSTDGQCVLPPIFTLASQSLEFS